MIDTHVHLFLEEFENDKFQVIEKAQKIGVKAFIMPNVDSKTIEVLLALSEQFPNICFPCIGVHPTSIKENFISEIELVERALEIREYAAIGEIGIDLHWDKTFLQEQIIAFDLQIKMALKYDLPIVVHTRQSFDEAFNIVSKYKNKDLKGVFHCFSGNAIQAKQLIDLGFKLGIGGVVTFKNSGLAETLKSVTLNDIVLETDAPYLAPSPFRGQRNEPAYIVQVVEKLSEIYAVDKNFVVEKTTKNATDLFKLNLLKD